MNGRLTYAVQGGGHMQADMFMLSQGDAQKAHI